MDDTAKTSEQSIRSEAAPAVVELRQYTLRSGKCDLLVDIFEREFVGALESKGIEVPGQFRDLDNPDRFVWLRSFPNMQNRPRMLDSFYSSPEWRKNRDAVNEILVDYDNVLLLRNAWDGSGFQKGPMKRSERSRTALVLANIHYLKPGANDAFVGYFREKVEPSMRNVGGPSVVALITEPALNNYPRLPIREGENVFVTFQTFENQVSYSRYLESLAHSTAYSAIERGFGQWYRRPIQTLKLVPTAHSKLG